MPGTASVFAERTSGGYFLDFDLKRDQLARYGLTIDDAENVLMSAVGGDAMTTTIEGRERYTVNVRYLRDYRSDIDSLQRVLVDTPSGAQVPLGEIADISHEDRSGNDSRRERTAERLCLRGCYRARHWQLSSPMRNRRCAEKVRVPTGYQLVWSGQYESCSAWRSG